MEDKSLPFPNIPVLNKKTKQIIYFIKCEKEPYPFQLETGELTTIVNELTDWRKENVFVTNDQRSGTVKISRRKRLENPVGVGKNKFTGEGQ